jgi:hypothetical protein
MSIQIAQKGNVQPKEVGHGLTQAAAHSTARLGGYTAIAGTLTMLIGAALWGTSGTDLWAALDSGDMAGYLAAIEAVKGQLVANLTVWILGVLIIGVAGSMLVALCTQRRPLARVAHVCFQTAVPLVIVSYIAMLAVVVQLSGESSATAVSIAEVIGWIGARADDLATALIIGLGPLFIALAGHGEWVPTWLLRWGYLAGIVGVLSVAFLYLPGMAAYGFIILPVGMGWMIAAGVLLLRQTKSAP